MSMQSELRQLLPVEAYVSPDWFRREQAELFGKHWAFVGMAEDFMRAGDYRCVQVGRHSLVVLRDKEGGLRAFHNSCRHRGTRLLEGSGNVGSVLTCFYHSWTYDLAGRLIGVPQEREQFPGLDKSCLGLRPAKVAAWKGMVFAHGEPDAGPFEAWLGAFPQKLGPHDPERMVEVADVLYRVRANWKIVVENFIDGYHLFHLHKHSLGDGDFTRQRWEPTGRHWTFYRPLKEGVTHDKLLLPVIAGVPSNFGAGAYVLFPSFCLYETATYWLTFNVIPVEAGLSHVHVRTRADPRALERQALPMPPPDQMPAHIIAAKGPHASMRILPKDVHPLESNNVTLEDVYACEAMQAGLESAGAAIGPLSRHESPLPFFQRQVLDHVAA